MSSEAITKNDLAAILNQVSVAPAGNYIAEDVNGDVSITRNVNAGGHIEAENLPGIIKMFAGTFAPTGWLLCNGAEVAVSDYPFLYDVIGDTYGTPSDSDHFVLPDLRGRMPLGSSNSHLLGSDGGSEYIQAHTHSNTIKAKTPKFTHTISSSNSNVNLLGGGSEQSYGKGAGSGSTYPYKRLSVADHAATDCTMSGAVGAVSGASTGDAGNMPPFLTINYIISTGGVSRWSDSAGLPIVRDVTVNGQSVVNNEIAQILTGTVLWTGTWSSGSKTISGLGDYLVYLFYEDAGNALIGFPNEAGHIRAFGLTGGAAGNQYAQTLGLAYSNGEYTFQYCNQVTHNVSGNHSAETSRSITKIIGLIPKIS